MGGCCVGNCCIMNNPIRHFFEDLFDTGGGGCGYHPSSTTTESHAKKIADELAEMKEKMRKSSEKDEKEIIEYINKTMTELLTYLESVNKKQFGGKTLYINLKEIKEKNDALKNNVVGSIGNFMDDRLQLKDHELSVILEERDDKKRGKNFDAFCLKIKRQAIDALENKIKETVKEQERLIRTEIESRLREVDENMQKVTQAYTDIVNIKEKDEDEMEKTRIKCMYQYEIAEILLDQLGG